MIGHFLLPRLDPVWAKLRQYSETYQVTPLSYKILLTTTFILALVLMALMLPTAGLIMFLLHFAIWAVYRVVRTEGAENPTAITLHVYGFCAATTYAIIYGLRDDFGMPTAFLFLSWLVLCLTNLSKPDRFKLIGGFEVGLSVAVMALFPVYVPAIAILFALACYTSVGLTFFIKKKE